MSTQKSPRSFETEIEIAAPHADVWHAISTADGFARWFAPEVVMQPEAGGELTWRWNDFFDWKQTIETWEPGKRLVTRYDSGVDDGAGGKRQLFVDFTVEARGAGTTTLRLVHYGFGPEADFDEEYDGISNGWPIELRSLRLYLEHHAGAERRLTWATAPVDLSPAEAWSRLGATDALAFGSSYDDAPEGTPFTLPAVDGDVLQGTILRCGSEELTARITSHGDAFLRLSADRCGGTTHVWLWLATYGEGGGDELDALQAHWDSLLARVFPERVAAAAAQPERASVATEG